MNVPGYPAVDDCADTHADQDVEPHLRHDVDDLLASEGEPVGPRQLGQVGIGQVAPEHERLDVALELQSADDEARR